MSAFTECCVPRRAPSPSGFVLFHGKFCPEGRGRQIDYADTERAEAWMRQVESRKRAEKLARQAEHPVAPRHLAVVPEDSVDYDLAYEQEAGK